ncbi:transcriptional regulator [Massilia endophytica]|uniref:transcriptional regulator n=1 Tax=Massilia endophytica TaxID=2899220 RepID=UPI001E4F8445|nr:transcriptional regulator [Massilia endophytica]UGQ47562.1 transcriptional regulator [Massilia endophytica]
MKPVIVLFAALSAAALVAFAKPSAQLPPEWGVHGNAPSQYEAGIGQGGIARGGDAKYLKHAAGEGNSWATLMQSVSAERYRGKRVRFEAKVRTEGVTQWAGLWMGVTEGGRQRAFHNTQEQPVSGDSGWQTRAVVLDVAPDANAINFGLICAGKGTAWIDELKFEVVGSDVPVTRFSQQRKLPTKPVL